MCGIFGYIGNKNNASQIVKRGLKKLDYRGYDSWGISYCKNNKLYLKKDIGEIAKVKELKNPPKSNVAIAHTRWATTGKVTKINAHPHLSSDKSFALAQNGIVENFYEIKKKLLTKKYKFISETDTEVIVRLIEDSLKSKKKFIDALRYSFLKLEGRNTIITLTKKGEIFAVKNGSPLVIGLNTKTKEIFFSSDTLSFAQLVDKIVVIKNNQLVYVNTKKEIKIFDVIKNKVVKIKFENFSIKDNKINKNGFDHFMIKEIFETPEVIKQIILQKKNQYHQLAKDIKTAKQVYTIGSGTAGIAANQIAFYLRVFGKINAINLIGSDARSYYEIFKKGDLIIAPSQSGETADVIEVLEYAKNKGAKIASIVNMPGSMMARLSSYPFLNNAGPEICVMSTKIFSSQISWGYLLAKTVAGKYEEGKNNLKLLATTIENYLNNQTNISLIKKLANKLYKEKDIFLLGKYQNFATVCEGMVKIIEGSYIHAHAIPAGDLKHYAITLMQKGISVIVTVSDDIVKNEINTAINELKLRGAKVIAIAHQKQSNFDFYIETIDTGETDAMSNVIPLQLLTYYMAIKLGNNIDKPRNIAKSVTVK